LANGRDPGPEDFQSEGSIPREFERLREIGEANLEMIRLVNAHCAHARVELSPLMGYGMAEGALGLPTNGREIRCEHAKVLSGASARLEHVAVEFYRNNCRGCPHRAPRGWPSLADLVARLDAEQAARQKEEEERLRAEAEARNERARGRRRLLATEQYATADIADILEAIDQKDPDEAAGERLVALARSAPELFTAPAITALVGTIRHRPTKAMLIALRYLAQAGRIKVSEACELALEILPVQPFREAAHFVVDFAASIEIKALRAVIPTLVLLAAREEYYMPGGQPPDPAPLRAAARRDLTGVLDEIGAWLSSDDRWRRSRGAGAVPQIIQVEPGTAPVLAAQLIDALGRERGDRYIDLYESPIGPIRIALGAAIKERPRELRELIRARAFTVSPDRRADLIDAYGIALRGDREDYPRERAVDPEVGRIVLEEAVARIGGDWGDEAAREAGSIIERVARNERELLKGHLPLLLGALLKVTETEVAAPSPLADPRPAILRQLEAWTARTGRSVRLRNLREAIASLSKEEPELVADALFSILDEREVSDEVIDRVRGEAVQLLGPLGRVPALLPRVVPHLYTALLSTDQLARAYAIDAWAEIAEDRALRLPPEMTELIPALLEDNYVIVHRAMVRALMQDIEVRDDQVDRVLMRIMGRAQAELDDPMFVEDAIYAIRRVAHMAKPEVKAVADAWCLHLADHLSPYDLDDFLLRTEDELSGAPAFTKLLLKALGAPELMDHQLSEHDRGLMLLLWRMPPRMIRRYISELRAAAFAQPKHIPAVKLVFVEALQQAGLWEEAESLAKQIEMVVPTTAEFATRRAAIDAVLRLARLERAISDGNVAAARDIVAEIRAALAKAGASSEDEG
jgi:hypothetical protein